MAQSEECNASALRGSEKWDRGYSCLNSAGNQNFKRSKSLSNICDGYTEIEIRRIHERLLRTNPQIYTSAIRNFSRKQKLAMVALYVNNFMSFCSMSILAPFFPKEAAIKGVSNTVSGFVFSFYALVMFLSSPIFGKLIPKIGAKRLLILGVLTTGLCNILFGVLEYITNYTSFVTFCFVIRGFEALGASAFTTATFVFVVHCFPDNIGSIIGMLETFVGLGMSVGPALGGFLYSLGGFEVPFFVLGVCLLLVIPLDLFLLPSIRDIKLAKSKSECELLRVPSVVLTCLIIMIISSTWGFLEPTLEPHLRQFNLEPEKVGLIFLMFSSLYAIFSPIWGWFCDRFRNHWSMMAWGMILNAISLLCLGPSPFIPFLKSALWLDIVSLAGMGISVALALLPTFECLLRGANAAGFRDSIATYSIVAGIWSSLYSLGEVVGPSLGGILLEYYGFPIASTVMAAMLLVVILPTLIFCSCNNMSKRDIETSSDSGISASWKSEYSEKSPLLQSSAEANHRVYVEEKIISYEQSRKMDYEIGEVNLNNPTDFRGTVTITPKGACEA